MNQFTTLRRSVAIAAIAGLALPLACTRTEEGAKSAGAPKAEQPAITNRVDVPAAVRQNLGITFAKVEPRNVAATFRLPGAFELLPSARREYCAPLAGRVELRVDEAAAVEAGAILYELDAPDWRALAEEIASTEAKVASMGPLRDAHRVHEESLARKVELWKARLVELDQIRAAGGGNAREINDARATLVATEAELAEIMEKDAALDAEQKMAEASLRVSRSRREALLRSVGGTASPEGALVIRAVEASTVASVDTANGALVERGVEVVETVRGEMLRVRARLLQSDLSRVRDGLAVRVVAAQGGEASTGIARAPIAGTLRIAPLADASTRTADVLVELDPAEVARSGWARAGVAVHVEVTSAGGGEELAIPAGAIVRDGTAFVIFRRDPANPDKVIRLEADLGVSDGRWTVVQSGVKAGDEIVVGGNYQLMLATSGSAPKGGHFHSDGTYHEGED